MELDLTLFQQRSVIDVLPTFEERDGMFQLEVFFLQLNFEFSSNTC